MNRQEKPRRRPVALTLAVLLGGTGALGLGAPGGLHAQDGAPALVFDSAQAPAAPAPRQTPPALPGPQDAVDRDGDGVATFVDLCPDSPPGTKVDQTGCQVAPQPWWVWAGGTAGLLFLFWMVSVPYARWQSRKRLREARIEQGAMPGSAGPFQPPGAPVPWSAPPAAPVPQPWQPPDLDALDAPVPSPEAPQQPVERPSQPSAATPPPFEPPAFDPPELNPPPPRPGGWRVGYPAPYLPEQSSPAPIGPGTPDPGHPGHPSDPGDSSVVERHSYLPPRRAMPEPVAATGVSDQTLFTTSPANPSGYHQWQDQPLHYEEEATPKGVAWLTRHPLLALGVLLALGLSGAAWSAQARRTPVPGPGGMAPVVLPTVVALSNEADDATSASSQIPARLRMIDGDAQVGRVGQRLPTLVAVQVEDEDGAPIAGVPVLFEATVGGGLVSPIATQTDSSGIARTSWTLGSQVVKQYVVARVAGSEAGVAFEADAAPGLASRVVVVRGEGQVAPPGQILADPVVVRVEGESGQPLEGIRVVFATDGVGSANPIEGVSDTLGQISTVWTLGPTGDSTVLRAEVADAPGIAIEIVARLSYPALPARAGVVAGGTHSCALSANGTLSCWGGNQSGQLGTAGGRAVAPRNVSAGQTFAEVSAGLSHTCGVGATGVAYCWGDNANAQLGDGSRTPQTTPRPVAAEVRFRRISAGTSHTCGISRESSIYCWGSNTHGQLGDGTRSDRDRPTRTTGGSTYTAVAVGWFHTCSLTSDGRASCWGRNALGQLGDGTTDDRSGPTPVTGSTRYRTLSSGGAHTCGLATDRSVYCWGQNNFGQLGDGGNQPRTRPTPVPGGAWSVVSAGGVHTCALDASGQAFCWGRNTYGQVGDDATTDRATPTPVAGGLVFATIRASVAHTCGTTTAGTQYCWGYNVEGQLGDGSRENRATPTQVRR